METYCLRFCCTALLFSFVIVTEAIVCAESNATQIGLILHLTGKRASIGRDAQDGALLALEELKKNGDTNIKLVFEDSAADPAKGVSAYKKLKAQGVKLIVTQTSSISLPIAPLVNRDEVLQLAISTTSDRYSTPNDLTFRINGSTKYEAEQIVNFLERRINKDSSRIAVITMEDEYPISLKKNVKKELKKQNLKPVAEEDFIPDELDFRAIISGLKRKGITDAILLAYQTQSGFFVRQAKELGLKLNTILTCVPVNNVEFFKSAGDAADGVFVTYIKTNSDYPAAFVYKNRYNKDVNFFSANGYDVVMVANKALKACSYKSDPECLKKELYKIKDFSGMSGNKGFDDLYGDMSDDYQVMVASGGNFQPVVE